MQPIAFPVLVDSPGSELDVRVKVKPAVIAKAQKHARFAISALDYEDAERSKKELRTALAILEG
jgi:vacuolar protein sorting-associated protein VTA1